MTGPVATQRSAFIFAAVSVRPLSVTLLAAALFAVDIDLGKTWVAERFRGATGTSWLAKGAPSDWRRLSLNLRFFRRGLDIELPDAYLPA